MSGCGKGDGDFTGGVGGVRGMDDGDLARSYGAGGKAQAMAAGMRAVVGEASRRGEEGFSSVAAGKY